MSRQKFVQPSKIQNLGYSSNNKHPFLNIEKIGSGGLSLKPLRSQGLDHLKIDDIISYILT